MSVAAFLENQLEFRVFTGFLFDNFLKVADYLLTSFEIHLDPFPDLLVLFLSASCGRAGMADLSNPIDLKLP